MVKDDKAVQEKARRDWAAFFRLMRKIDVPEDFMAERPMNAPPVERMLFREDD